MGETTNMVTQSLSYVTSIFTQAVNMISDVPVALAYIGISLAGAGIGLFGRVKSV